ncbi:MAG: hypothetical protein WCH03_01095 [Flavobacteriia bacterium]
MPNRLTFILPLFVLISCSENKSGKMKDLDSIRSKSTYHEKKVVTPIDQWKDTLFIIYNQDSVELNIQSIENDSSRYFFHEFNYWESAMYSLTDSNNHTFHHQFARFKTDSTNVKNNFFNWFDKEFCQRNMAVRIYNRMNIFPKHIFFVCTNQSIHVVKSDTKIDPMKWLKFIQRTEEKVKFIYICHQKKNKPALWYTFEQNKLILIPAQ